VNVDALILVLALKFFFIWRAWTRFCLLIDLANRGLLWLALL
jgi:hypothetical protein